jgi:hypothetical protein
MAAATQAAATQTNFTISHFQYIKNQNGNNNRKY